MLHRLATQMKLAGHVALGNALSVQSHDLLRTSEALVPTDQLLAFRSKHVREIILCNGLWAQRCGCSRSVGSSLFGIHRRILDQRHAGPLAIQERLEMIAPVVDQMGPIRDLSRMREGLTDGLGKPMGAIPANHLDFRMTLPPGGNRFDRPVSEEIQGFARFSGKEKGSVRVSSPQSNVINSSAGDMRPGWIGDGSPVPEQGRCLHRHGEPRGQALAHLGRSGESHGFAFLQKAVADSCPRLNQIWEAFCKDVSWAGRDPASTRAHQKPENDASASAWHIRDGSLILAVDRI